MNRRLFFKNLLGGSAALVVAPSLLAEIVENDYIKQVEGKPLSDLFTDEGFWVFNQEDKLVAWSENTGITLKMTNDMIDIDIPFNRGDCQYIPGKSRAKWVVENLHFVNSPMELNWEDKFKMIHTMKGRTIEAEAYRGNLMIIFDKHLSTFDRYRIEFHVTGAVTIL